VSDGVLGLRLTTLARPVGDELADGFHGRSGQPIAEWRTVEDGHAVGVPVTVVADRQRTAVTVDVVWQRDLVSVDVDAVAVAGAMTSGQRTEDSFWRVRRRRRDRSSVPMRAARPPRSWSSVAGGPAVTCRSVLAR
jgi:hypothetical protein